MKEEFGERLKILRKESGLSQAELGDKLNVHTQTISKWERGISEPDISQMSGLSEALNVSLEKLFGCKEGEQTFAGNFSAERLGEYIAYLRTQQNESQQQIAEICASSADAVSRWERGVTCPDINALLVLADHFNMPVSKLYYAVSDEADVPVVIAEKKRRKTIAFLASALAATIIVAATLITVLWVKQPDKKSFTVTIDGTAYTVSENNWFMPQAAVKAGYDFIGWQDEKGESVSVPCQITENCELRAVYSPHEYDIYYWLYGGEFPESVVNKITVETGAVNLPLPRRQGAEFAGWYTVPDYSQNSVTQIICEGKDVHLYAKWENITYTVTVDGEAYNLSENDWFTPPTAIKVGYDFVGWMTESGEAAVFPYKVVSDCAFYAEYTPHDYNIDYWLNGGTFGSSFVSDTFTVESGEIALPVPKKAGSLFEGWYLEGDYNGDAVTQISCRAENVALYAKWSDETYTVRYELNGGILYEENPQSVTRASEIALNNPLRKGYLFLGWYDAQEGGNCVDTVGGANAKNLTLYAQWQKSDAAFDVTYELNGGVLSDTNPSEVRAWENYLLNSPVKTGYDFLGWNDRANGTGNFYEALCGIQEDLSLYAIYRAKEYLVRYEYEGIYAYGECNPNNITYGESVTLYPVYRNGYTFTGWFTSAEGGSKIEVIDESNLIQISILFARFSPDIYEIELNADGGTFVTPDGERQAYTYRVNFDEELILPDCTKGGYVFLGWMTQSGEYVEKINAINIGNMTLTAAWRESDKRYNIAYELNGGKLETENPESVLCGQVLPLSEPARENYIFLGWYDNEDGRGSRYAFTPAERESDITLYALWQEIKVSGSSTDFVYEKNMASGNITIKGYTGAYGKNIDLTIPAVVEGLPVIAVEGMRYGQGYNYLHSLTIPEGIVRLGDYAFQQLGITLPVTIPASVEEIGEECFKQCRFNGLYFAEDCKLKIIGINAFERINTTGNVLHLPLQLEELRYRAFYMAAMAGIILPDSLKRINSGALILNTGNTVLIGDNADFPKGFHIYLPVGIEYIASQSVANTCYWGTIYAGFSEAWAERFEPQWNSGDRNNGSSYSDLVYGVQPVRVRLHDEDKETVLTGNAFELPVPEKDGYTFIGWRSKSGRYANQYLVAESDCDLYAVFEPMGEHDGWALDRIAYFKADVVYEFDIRCGMEFYFQLEDLNAKSVIINFGGWEYLYYIENGEMKTLTGGQRIMLSPQGYFKACLSQYLIVVHMQIRITVLN